MAVLQGGIFSRPRGKTGGIVFGAARTRQGKLVTSRLLVPPSNPNTADQQTQRTKFSECQTIVRTLGPGCYQDYFNRSVGQLPGFQSMQSLFMQQMDGSFDLTLSLQVNLGTLHFPDSCVLAQSAATEFTVTYSSELGSNGTAADKVGIICVPQDQTTRAIAGRIIFQESDLRSGSPATVAPGSAGVTYEVYVFMIGAGTAAGLLSVCKPFDVTIT